MSKIWTGVRGSGVAVGPGVGVAVGSGVGVAVGSGVGVAVGSDVGLAVGSGVGVAVGSGVGVAVGSGTGVAVGAEVASVAGSGAAVSCGSPLHEDSRAMAIRQIRPIRAPVETLAASRWALGKWSPRACRQNRNKMVDYFGECECVELRYGGSASASRPFGQGLGTIETLLAWWSRQKGRPARDNRLFLNAVFWILRTGAPCGTCRRITGTGRTPIDAFAGGETAVSGTNCWSGSSKIRTLSG